MGSTPVIAAKFVSTILVQSSSAVYIQILVSISQSMPLEISVVCWVLVNFFGVLVADIHTNYQLQVYIPYNLRCL